MAGFVSGIISVAENECNKQLTLCTSFCDKVSRECLTKCLNTEFINKVFLLILLPKPCAFSPKVGIHEGINCMDLFQKQVPRNNQTCDAFNEIPEALRRKRSVSNSESGITKSIAKH